MTQRKSTSKLVDLKALVLGAIVPVAIVLIWHAAVTTGTIPSSLVASPSDTATGLIRLVTSGDAVEHSIASLQRLLAGFLIGSALALWLGLWAGTSRLVDQVLSPLFSFLGPIPPIAWIPLLIILFGIGDGSKIALIAIGSFFVVFTSVFAGVRGVQKEWIEIGSLYRKNRFEINRKILLPAALAQVFTSARVALALSWILLIAAEVIASSKGLGWLIWDSRNFSRPDDMIAGMIVVGFLGKLSDVLMVWLQHRMLPWRKSFEGI